MAKDRRESGSGSSAGWATSALQSSPGKSTLVPVVQAAGGALPKTTIDLNIHPPEHISTAVDDFYRALEGGRADAAQLAWTAMSSSDRVAFGKSHTIDRDLQTIMRVLGPMLVPIMGECKLDFTGRTPLIEQILQVGHPNWFDPISDYGGTLLSSFIAYLPPRGTIDQSALAKLQRLMSGTTSLALARPLFERIYSTTLSDTTYDPKKVQTVPWTADHIHRLYDVLSTHLPLAHVRTITAFYLGKGIDHAWWTSDSRVVLPEKDAKTTDNRKHRMTGGSRAQMDPVTEKGETKGQMDKFDVGSLHEVGHGVGGRLGGHAWAESYPWVGWKTKIDADTWSKALWGDDATLTQRTRAHAGNQPVLTSVDARHYLADDLHKSPKLPAGFTSTDQVEAAIADNYADQKLTKYWQAQQGQDIEQAYLFSGSTNYGNDSRVYVYLSRNHSQFSSYNQQAHQQKVSWYSLSSPHEWFAEQYAHYYRTQRIGNGLEPGVKAKLDELDQAKPTDDTLMKPSEDDAAGDGTEQRRVPFPW